MIKLTEELKYEYLVNCAVLVEMDGEKILFDGLFWDDTPFDRMPGGTEKRIMDRSGEFEGLSNLIFSHCHEDHFSSEKAVSFLKEYPDTFVAVPDMSGYGGADEAEKKVFSRADDFSRHPQDTGSLSEYGRDVFYLRGETGEVNTLSINGVDIEYLKTGHLTFDYPEHYIFNVIGPDTNVILTADMDLLRMDFLRKLTMKEHSFIFLGNIALWHKKWRDDIDGMGFEKVFIYHVPSEENDSLGYRRKALKCWGRYHDKYPAWEALNLDEIH